MNKPGRLGGFLVAATLIAVPSAWGQGFASKRGGGAAAIVNGEPIPIKELNKLLDAGPPPVRPLTPDQQREIRKMALDMLINDVLLKQFLARAVPQVPESAVNVEMTRIRNLLAQKKISYAKFLADTGQSDKSLREDILTRVRWKLYLERKLPDSLMRRYYQANKPFFDKVRVRARHILVKLPPNASQAEKDNVRRRLQYLRQRIVRGEITFAEAAKKYSHCPSRKKGGDIGEFPLKFAVSDAFARAAFAMKVGEISEPVETEYGLHLIKVTGRTPGTPSKYEDVRDLVRQVYAQDVQLIPNLLAEERKKARIEILAP